MRYFDAQTLAFLRDLKKHNDRAWFAENKDRYEGSVKEPFLQFISDVGPELRKVSTQLVADPRPVGGSMFRIYRDVRFSRDKSPYKTHVGAHFPFGGKGVHGPGYYLHLEPASCFVAGGMWMPEPADLQRIRERISDWSPVMRPRAISTAITPTATPVTATAEMTEMNACLRRAVR